MHELFIDSAAQRNTEKKTKKEDEWRPLSFVYVFDFGCNLVLKQFSISSS